LDISQDINTASKVSENSAILNNTSLIHLNDKIQLVNNSRKNKRIPLEKLKCTMENDLEISSINHDEKRNPKNKLFEKIGHRVNLPKEEEESKEIVTDKTKIQVWTRPMGSRIHKGGGSYNQYVGLTQINNYSVRRKKIKRNAILPNLPRTDDV